jgi:hypothetical protein
MLAIVRPCLKKEAGAEAWLKSLISQNKTQKQLLKMGSQVCTLL